MLLGQFLGAERAMPRKTAITNLLNLSDILLLLHLLLEVVWLEFIADFVGVQESCMRMEISLPEVESC